MTDWKALAQKRRRELLAANAWREYVRCSIYNNLRRELGTQLHARCIGRSEEMAAEIAAAVSMKITGFD